MLVSQKRHLHNTQSICPECLDIIGAEIFGKDGKVWISKDCAKHGNFTELYWGSYELYKKAQKFASEGRGVENPAIAKKKITCPKDCGLCSEHQTNSTLTNIVLTNRCDLNCWYCFFFAERAGYVYEPTIGQIRQMVRNIMAEKPIRGNAVQLTGGEPTLRPDLIEIINMIRQEGIDHIQLNTDGVNISQKPELAQAVGDAGVSTLYLSFDGVTERTNPKNHREIPGVLKNCRKADLGIVLVPTVIKGVNDHEVGDMLRFGFNNIDIVRGINFQPVSLVGRMPKRERDKYRITIPDVMQRIEEQTAGQVTVDDFYPVPTVVPLAKFIEHLRKRPQYELSAHFACGMATYIFKDGAKMVPITKFLDVNGLVEFLNERTEELAHGRSKYVVGARTLFKINSFIDKEKMPKDLNLGNILANVFIKHDYRSLGVFHHRALFVGMMHFMDLYNYDIERVKKCAIHYATPSREMPIVPFCAFNVIPEWYRDKIQMQFGVPVAEWERLNGRKLSDDLYRRSKLELEISGKAIKEKTPVAFK